MRGLRWVLMALMGILLVGLAPLPAHAHATLIATDPVDGAQLTEAPHSVSLTFSEHITVVPGSVRLLGAGQDSGPLAARAANATVTAELPALAGDARHSVAWRVVSSDGHPISGLLTFTIGNPPPAPAETLGSRAVPRRPAIDAAYTVATSIWYAMLLGVAGLLAFQALCVRPAGPSDRAYPPPYRLLGAGAALGLSAAVALIPLSVALATGALPVAPATWAGIAGWRPLVAAGLTGVGLTSAYALQRRARTVPALIAAGLALVSPVFTGHQAAVGPIWVMVAGDLVHLAATAVWVGGLLGLVLYLRATRAIDGPVPPRMAVLRRFSGLAAVALLAAAVSGLVMAVLIVPSWADLTGTAYGRLLLLKVELVILAAALGAWTRFHLLPAVRRARLTTHPWPALARTVGRELTLLVAVALLTGGLVNLSPGGRGESDRQDAPIASTPAEASTDPGTVRGASGSLVVEGTLTPLPDGSKQLRFTTYTADGERADPIEPPTVSASLPTADLGPVPYESRDSPTDLHGTYLVDLNAAVPGRWELLIGVRLSTFTQQTVRIELDL